MGKLILKSRHRLLCGDSSKIEDVSKVMQNEKADMIFTDPPYNLGGECEMLAKDIRQESYGKLKDAEWDRNFHYKNFIPSFESILENGSIYICTSHRLIHELMPWLIQWADMPGLCVWEKTNPFPSLRKKHWTWSFELIVHGTKGSHVFNFPESGHASNVWHFQSELRNRIHPTQKPIAIPEHAITHSSLPGQVVADLFGGSGSTLIACEKTGRHCRMIEIDPRFCDAIVRRWEKYTGKKASLYFPIDL